MKRTVRKLKIFISHLTTKLHAARGSIRYRWFVWENKMLRHPVGRHVLPKKNIYRRLIGVLLCLLILVPGFLVLFRPQAARADWYSGSWQYRKKIVIDHKKVASNQTDFPVLISITDTELSANTQSDGDDILFAGSNGSTKLSHEIETYTSSTGELIAWVEVPTLSSTKDTVIYMYYGNSSAASQQDAINTWDTNYKAVWHMEETGSGAADEFNDSTTNANHGTGGGGIPGQTTGQIGTGQVFNGTSDYISANDDNSLDVDDYTFSTWVNLNNIPATWSYFLAKQEAHVTDYSYSWRIENAATDHYEAFHTTDGTLGTATENLAQITTIGLDSWHLVTYTYDGTNVRSYLDGALFATTGYTGTLFVGTGRVTIGARWNTSSATGFIDGSMDEIRISNTPRSADWIATEYNNQSSPSTFISLQQTEAYQGPLLHWKFDEGSGTSIGDASPNNNSATMSASVTWQNKDLCLFEGNCLKFGSANSYVSRGYSSDTDLNPGTSSFSVAAWFRHPTSFSGRDTIVSRVDAINGVGYKLYYDSTAGLCFAIDGTAGSFPSDDACTGTSVSFADNRWHYVEGVKSGTSYIKLFVDGKEADVDGSITASSLSGTSPPFTVGTDWDGSQNAWDGFIDEVKYYDYERSPGEIKSDYAAKGSVLGVSATFGVADANSSLSQGLVAYWKLDDGVGNACSSGVDKACDSSGNGNVGTWTSGAASTSGKFAYATNFDGTDDYIDVTDNSSMEPTTAITVSAWIYADSWAGGNGRIVQKGAGDNQYRLLDENDLLKFHPNVATNDTVTAPLPSTGAWHHVVGVFDSTQTTIRLYVDGQIVAEETDATGTINTTTDALNIGNKPGSVAAGDHFDGKIDDVRIYNRALSPAEVTNLYDWAPGPVGWWKLDERTGTTAYDVSTNGNNGTLTNGPRWVAGKYGSSVQFDGSNDSVEVTDDDILDYSSGISVGAWFNNTSLPTASATNQGIASKIYWNSDTDNGGYTLKLNHNGGVTYVAAEAYNSSGVGTTAAVREAFSDTNHWHYAAVTYDGAILKLYLDGVLVDSTSYTGGSKNISQNFTIAEDNGANYFAGRIDDVRVYNYIRTEKQIVKDMNAGHPAVGSPVGSALGHWKFDDGFGTTASNSGSVGSALNGTRLGAIPPTWRNEGKFGKALNFSGSSAYVKIGNDASVQITSDLTLSSWVYLSSTSINQDIIAKRGAAGQWGYRLWVDSSGIPKMDVVGSENNMATVSAVASLTANRWYHLVGTYASGSALTIYVDGKQKNRTTTAIPMSIKNSTADLNIGAENAGSTNMVNGSLDEVKLYNTALNANEVLVEYNFGKAAVLGSLSADPDGAATNSADRYYCPPGDSSGNCAAGSNPSPAGEWNFNQNRGTVAHDLSTNGNNGTLSSTASWARGKIGGAVRFDEAADNATAPDSNSLDADTTVTVEAWVNSDTYSGAVGRTILAKSSGSNDNYVLQTVGDEISFGFWNGAAYATHTTTGVNLLANRWYHLVGTYDENNQIVRIYVDGVKVYEAAETDNMSANATTLKIGSNGVGTEDWEGEIDDMRIYTYVRTPTQIKWDYNRGRPVGWWRFDECTGSTLYDTSWTASGSASRVNGTWSGGSGTNTSAGTCNSGTSSEVWNNGATGRFNSSLDFDKTDDVVTIRNNDAIWLNKGLVDGFTISAWVNADDAGEGSGGQIFSKGANTYCRTENLVGSHLDLECSLDLATDATINVGNAFDTGGWHNVVLSWSDDSDDEVSVWIDGKLRGTSNGASGVSAAENNSLLIGNDSSGASTFSGRIDQVMIFSYEMNATLIRTLYNEFSAVRFGPASGKP